VAITAGQRSAAAGGQAKRIRHKVNLKRPSRTKLGIMAVEMQIRQDQMHTPARNDTHTPPTEPSINKFLKKQPHPAAIFALSRSNKQLYKPD
jgi:hypothetical protein